MVKITDIVPQKKDSKRVSIFIDKQFAFGLSLELRFEKKLEVGKNLSEKQIKDLIESDQFERLLNNSLRFLSFRPRSEKEIIDHLLRKGKLKGIEKSDSEKEQYSGSIQKVVNKLKKLDQVNDKEFAKWWIEQRQRFKPRGSRAIRVELLQKGIDREMVRELLDEKNTVSEEELAIRVALKKIQSYKRLVRVEFMDKMAQHLARRGFSWDVVKKVVDTIEKNR